MQKRLYNLDGLRFLAAWVVLLCHLEALKSWFGFHSSHSRFYINSAQAAVTFFYVLSGFLISYLLLKEKRENTSDKINVGRFYLKRIKRIWPLYYLLLILCFFVIKNTDFFYQFPRAGFHDTTVAGGPRFFTYLFFLPNTAEIFFGKQMYLSQTWSLGTEEFFYLLFPLALYLIRWKSIPLFLLTTVILFTVLSISLPLISQSGSKSSVIDIASLYFDRYRIYSFALGGLAAWLLLNEKRGYLIDVLKNKFTVNFLVLLLPVVIIFGLTASVATQQLYSVFFAAILFSITATGIKFSLLNNPVFIYLGKISYGIYMLHPITLIITLRCFESMKENSLLLFLLPAAATLLTIVVSVISYECFEKFFLRRKKITG